MGIKGLTYYMNSRFRGWKRISLSNCPVVLDGNGLCYKLKELTINLHWEFGGQYEELRKTSRNFFDSLLAQNIKPLHIVFDGIDPKEEKQKVLVDRKRARLNSINSCLHSGSYNSRNILPPLISEVFRKEIQYYEEKGHVVVYTADGEADGIAATFANKYKCHLVGDDSDYFIFPLDVGYIPFSKLHWTRPGFPVTGSVYKREVFAASLNISPDLVLAIPAIAGNDIIPSLMGNTFNVIDLLRRKNHQMLKENFPTEEMVFTENFEKCKEIYGTIQIYNDSILPFTTLEERPIPDWVVKQFQNYQFTNDLLETLVTSRYLLHIVPEDFDQPSAKLFSRPIRQSIYKMMFVRQDVIEIVRKDDNLVEEIVVGSEHQDLTIRNMNSVPVDERIRKLCQVLLCDPSSIGTSIKHKWYLPIASVCFWSKTANMSRDDIKLKALVLTFAKCYYELQNVSYGQPFFDISTLHLYTQWQCTYYDAILLNQVLALPLPYLSPATIFDGKLVTYYSQRSIEDFQSILDQCDIETKTLYDTILHIVYANIN